MWDLIVSVPDHCLSFYFLFQFLYDRKQLPPCMLNDNFQVFGIHVYLQEPTKLLCTPVVKKTTATTQSVPVHTQRPPPRTLITVVDSEKRSKSHNYAYNSDTSSSSSQNRVYFCLCFIVLWSIFFS